MDLQTYTIWKHGIGCDTLPSQFTECVKRAKTLQEYLSLVKYCDKYERKHPQF